MRTLLQPHPRPTQTEPASATGRAPARAGVLLAVVLGAQLMVVLDATIVNVALPRVQASLQMSPAALSWVLNAYVLAFGGLLLLGARAGDLFGRRRAFLVGIAVFCVSSLAGGFATAPWMLLASRGLQGVGAALAAPSALSLLTASFQEGAARLRAIALYTTMSAAGGAIGLVAGGLLTQLASWRWVMFVNVPIGAAVLLAGRAVLPETARRRGSFDLLGAITSTLGMTSLVLGLVDAGQDGWHAVATAAPLAAGIALLAAFVVIERTAAEPIMPLRLFASRTRTAANVSRALLYAGMFGTLYFLGQFLQDVQGYAPLAAGLAFLPMPLSIFTSSQVTSRVLVRLVPQRTLLLSSTLLAAAALASLTQVQAHSPYLQIAASLVALGAGAGCAFVAMMSASLHAVRPEDAGAASGLVNVAQQLGGALGLAILVNLFQGGAGRGLAAAHGAAAGSDVHGLVVVFAGATGFALLAAATIAIGVRPRPLAEAPAADEEDPAGLEELAWAVEAA